jgi:hypothetical protein
MSTRQFCVYNETRESLLGPRVAFLDTRSDPLAAVKVLIEGLAPDADTGLWLTPLKSIPAVPRLSAYDLVYLDRDGFVVHGVELVPDDKAPRVDGAAASALVLPIHSFAASQALPGDRFVLRPAEEMEAVAPSKASLGAAGAPVVPIEPGKSACGYPRRPDWEVSGADHRAITTPVSAAQEPSVALEKILPYEPGPLARPRKWGARPTALEPVNPLAEIRPVAAPTPRFALLHTLRHLRIRVQISISTAPSPPQGSARGPLQPNAGRPGVPPSAEPSRNAVAGAATAVGSGVRMAGSLLGRRWTSFVAAYVRWAESFMFRPAPMVPRLNGKRKARFLF